MPDDAGLGLTAPAAKVSFVPEPGRVQNVSMA